MSQYPLTFGIGCWSFEPCDPADGDSRYLSDSYAELIETALADVPGIRNVEIVEPFRILMFGDDPSEEELRADADRTTTMAEVLSLPRFSPQPVAGRLRFKVDIAVAIQKGIALHRDAGLGEVFTVDIHYSHNFPVAFVWTESPADRPSMALVVVREYLKRELNLRNSPIKIRILGPSPFWADGYTGPSSAVGDTDAISARRDRSSTGYDSILVRLPSNVTEPAEVVEQTAAYLRREFAQYYTIQSEYQRQNREWHAVERTVDGLVELNLAKGPWNSIKRWFTSGRRSRSAGVDLLRFQTQYARQLTEQRGAIDAMYGESPSRLIESDLNEKAISGFDTTYPNVRELLALVDARRASDMNLLAVVGSSLGGGAVGAVLTAFIGG